MSSHSCWVRAVATPSHMSGVAGVAERQPLQPVTPPQSMSDSSPFSQAKQTPATARPPALWPSAM
jgi:hypothetical protein